MKGTHWPAIIDIKGYFVFCTLGERARTVISGCKAKRGTLGVIGAKDGNLIPIQASKSCPENYINR